MPGGELEPGADAGERLAKQVDFYEACICKHILAGQERGFVSGRGMIRASCRLVSLHSH